VISGHNSSPAAFTVIRDPRIPRSIASRQGAIEAAFSASWTGAYRSWLLDYSLFLETPDSDPQVLHAGERIKSWGAAWNGKCISRNIVSYPVGRSAHAAQCRTVSATRFVRHRQSPRRVSGQWDAAAVWLRYHANNESQVFSSSQYGDHSSARIRCGW